jgi:hypothetical protein
MSKRAEELARKAWDFNSKSGEWPEYRDAITALIDAELKAGRERCAERYCKANCGANNCAMGIQPCNEYTAILSDEEK